MAKYKQEIALVISILAITIVHYTTRLDIPQMDKPFSHVVHLLFRILYIAPLICAAYWYRFRGGLLAFFLVTALYVPHIIIQWKGSLDEDLNKLGFFVIFLVVTVTTATLATLELRQRESAAIERARRSRLQRYLSPLLVDEVLSSPEEFGFLGRDFNVSVLFADICGFTALSEKLEPAMVMTMLNRIFETFGKIVFDHEGTLNQIIGDEIFAIFGAPKEQDDHADRALQAAIQIEERISSLIADRKQLRIRIGINTGTVTAGSLGSIERMEYTVIGDTVNLASRLCDLAEPGQILISANTRNCLLGKYILSEAGNKKVKGRDGLVEVFAVQPQPVPE